MDVKELESITLLLARGFYSMAFQPIFGAREGLLGFEALLRGPVGTPLATPGRLFNQEWYSDGELMCRLDLACIGSAVRTSRMLRPESMIFINVHGNTVPQLSLDALRMLLDEVGISPERVVFELSEKTNQDHVKGIAKHLRPFRDAGVKVALDDVGSRNPWLMHMLWVEPDFVKVDRAIISGVDSRPRKQALVHGLVLLVEKMGGRLIAEGIETEGESRALLEVGVPLMQGYYFGRPMPAEHWLGREAEGQGPPPCLDEGRMIFQPLP